MAERSKQGLQVANSHRYRREALHWVSVSISSIVVGRSRDCDVVIDEVSVSARHARLSWANKRIRVEDLGSANGTFVGDERTRDTTVRPGDDLRFGRAAMPWSDPQLRAFLRAGGGETVEARNIPGRRFVCGSCGARGVMPANFGGGVLRCGRCAQRLVVDKPKRGWGRGLFLLLLFAGGLGGVAYLWQMRTGDTIAEAAARLGIPSEVSASASPQEASIRAHTREKVTVAIDVTTPLTRNTAAQIAAGDEGPFSVEQVARIWTHAREEWRYVNDPRGDEYFARASETIANDYVGDCDDFAILLVAMIESIGGEARIVMMDGPGGGHAYAEVCIASEADDVRDRLRAHYRSGPRAARRVVSAVHYRPGDECGLWLNLDWNAGVPGGEYESESWAVGIYADGRTETLAPANAPAAAAD